MKFFLKTNPFFKRLWDHNFTLFKYRIFLMTCLSPLVIFWLKSGHLTHPRGFWVPFWHIYSCFENGVQNRWKNGKNEKVSFHKVPKKGFFSYFYQSFSISIQASRAKKIWGVPIKKRHFGVCLHFTSCVNLTGISVPKLKYLVSRLKFS